MTPKMFPQLQQRFIQEHVTNNTVGDVKWEGVLSGASEKAFTILQLSVSPRLIFFSAWLDSVIWAEFELHEKVITAESFVMPFTGFFFFFPLVSLQNKVLTYRDFLLLILIVFVIISLALIRVWYSDQLHRF